MRNGYFQLVNTDNGFGVKLFPPIDGGDNIVLNDLIAYLKKLDLIYDLPQLKRAVDSGTENIFFLAVGECPKRAEEYALMISADLLTVTAVFFPPSETGSRMSMEEFIRDLSHKKIVYGLQTESIKNHFMSDEHYCTEFVVAKGLPQRQGKDAWIEYHFSTEINKMPTLLEDGSVDYFNLNIINHCKKGELLATLHPADDGNDGVNVNGATIKPGKVLHKVLKKSELVDISEDGLRLFAACDGQVHLENEKVIVSNIYKAQNIDLSTGNITFDGSILVEGNVSSNMRVTAKDNIEIKGVVEGAVIEAGGNIIIAGGMNGMSKGYLKAGGNIVARFFENAQIEAGGYVQAESVLYSRVTAGTDILVSGKKGFITGGHAKAAKNITAKTFGSVMGTVTTIEVGEDPELMARYQNLQIEVSELVKQVKNIQTIIMNFNEKKAKGVQFTKEQLISVRNCVVSLDSIKKELVLKNNMMNDMAGLMNENSKPEVVVLDVAYQGTNIIVEDVSMQLKKNVLHSRFRKLQGNVHITPCY